MKATGIILAGGKSSRMNYQDKAWLLYEGKPLIHHAINRLSLQVAQILISRNSSDQRYEKLPYTCIPDLNHNLDGPLAGILACSSHVTNPLSLVIPCDSPNVPENLKSLLLPHLSGADAVVPSFGGICQPLFILAKTSILGSIAPYISAGGRSVKGWLQNLSIAQVDFMSQEPFKNINSPEQLK
ncbi:molybdenum cofactor guanylyltransferase [Gammaproteobacteria bacterium]|nr:molybdenum cofactor guanylyltransferase [Gammaproteobacteria bacterium]